MFAYCNNNPINHTDPTGHYSSSSEDNDGNGIPDYLDCRWFILTATVKARQMGARATVSENGISFNFAAEYDEFCEIAKGLGEYGASTIIAQSACAKYLASFGRPFVLTNSCVANEYYEHVLAFQWAVKDRALPNDIVIGWGVIKKYRWQDDYYSAESVYAATASIDINPYDGGFQAFAFGYKNGIRDCYIGGADDPWGSIR